MLVENIIKFIKRANSDSFTNADIRNDFRDLDCFDEDKYKIDISFGQFNNRSEVPWISILDKSNEQKTANGIYPVYLYYKAINKLIFAYGISAEIPPDLNWNDDILINNVQIRDYFLKNPSYNNIFNYERRTYKDSYVYQIYDIVAESDNVQIFQNNNIVSNSKLEEDLIQILDSYEISLGVKNNYDDFTSKPDIKSDDYDDIVDVEFALENHLEDYLIQHWDKTVLGREYKLLDDEEGIKNLSQQYRLEIGSIDILARHKDKDQFIVIELKRGRSADKTVGQLQKYLNWIDENRESKFQCKGIIISSGSTAGLNDSIKGSRFEIDVYFYNIAFSLEKQEIN